MDATTTDRDWTGFKWKNHGGVSEVIGKSNTTGMWIFIHYVNNVGIAGGAVGASYLEAIQQPAHQSDASSLTTTQNTYDDSAGEG